MRASRVVSPASTTRTSDVVSALRERLRPKAREADRNLPGEPGDRCGQHRPDRARFDVPWCLRRRARPVQRVAPPRRRRPRCSRRQCAGRPPQCVGERTRASLLARAPGGERRRHVQHPNARTDPVERDHPGDPDWMRYPAPSVAYASAMSGSSPPERTFAPATAPWRGSDARLGIVDRCQIVEAQAGHAEQDDTIDLLGHRHRRGILGTGDGQRRQDPEDQAEPSTTFNRRDARAGTPHPPRSPASPPQLAHRAGDERQLRRPRLTASDAA